MTVGRSVGRSVRRSVGRSVRPSVRRCGWLVGWVAGCRSVSQLVGWQVKTITVHGHVSRLVASVEGPLRPGRGGSDSLAPNTWGHTSGFTRAEPARGVAHLGLHRPRRVPQVGTSR